MSQPRVLNVGQCGFDNRSIANYLERNFGATVQNADAFPEALEALRAERFDLVLVNRVTDFDETPGLDLIRTIKADPTLARVPVMLVSDFSDAQADAEREGAIKGFGKTDVRPGRNAPALREFFSAREREL
jgi:CheY-like chemotaxis protein